MRPIIFQKPSFSQSRVDICYFGKRNSPPVITHAANTSNIRFVVGAHRCAPSSAVTNHFAALLSYRNPLVTGPSSMSTPQTQLRAHSGAPLRIPVYVASPRFKILPAKKPVGCIGGHMRSAPYGTFFLFTGLFSSMSHFRGFSPMYCWMFASSFSLRITCS